MKNEFLDITIGRNRPTPRFMSLVESLTVTVFDGNGSDRSITLDWKPSREEADGCDFLMMSNLTKGFAITVEVGLVREATSVCVCVCVCACVRACVGDVGVVCRYVDAMLMAKNIWM